MHAEMSSEIYMPILFMNHLHFGHLHHQEPKEIKTTGLQLLLTKDSVYQLPQTSASLTSCKTEIALSDQILSLDYFEWFKIIMVQHTDQWGRQEILEIDFNG